MIRQRYQVVHFHEVFGEVANLPPQKRFQSFCFSPGGDICGGMRAYFLFHDPLCQETENSVRFLLELVLFGF